MSRIVVIAIVGCVVGCAPPEGASSLLRWSSYQGALARDERAFSFELEGPGTALVRTRIGSWSVPFSATGRVLKVEVRDVVASPTTFPRPYRYTVVLAASSELFRLQYDAPKGTTPLIVGQRVRVRAHKIVLEAGTAQLLSFEDRRGDLLLAGVRTPTPELAVMPPGWSVEYGPTYDREPLCDGHVYDRAVRVHSPWGVAVALPGAQMESEVGPGRTRYVIETMRARSSDASCARAQREQGLSLVIRRLTAG